MRKQQAMPVSSPRLGATRIVILGGGYVGMYTALTLQKKLRGAIRKGDVHVTVVDPSSVMTYQPFLAEASAGSLEPRHVVVPLRQVLKKCTIITGFVSSISAAKRYVRVEPIEGEPYDLFFDHLVVCPGSVSRTLPIPGLADVGLGFKSVAEAIYLRNRVLGQLDAASSTDQADIRRKALSFVVIGGGYAGIELLAELEDFSRSALKFYPTIGQEELHWHLVEATGRILAEVSESLGQYTVTQLEKRDIAVHLNVKVKDLTGGHVVLDDGTEFDSQTIMWTAGVKPNPVVGRSDLPVDSKGRLKCHPTLEVEGHHNVWGAGDSAAVPDLSKAAGEFCGPSAQHAVRQARQLGKNIARAYSGHGPNDYKHKYVGSVASLGLYKGVAELYGVHVKGFLAWFVHRTYHMSRVPTTRRKVQVIADWTLALLFNRDYSSLGTFSDPRRDFRLASGVEDTPTANPSEETLVGTRS